MRPAVGGPQPRGLVERDGGVGFHARDDGACGAELPLDVGGRSRPVRCPKRGFPCGDEARGSLADVRLPHVLRRGDSGGLVLVVGAVVAAASGVLSTRAR